MIRKASGRATLLLDEKSTFADGTIREVRVWRLPAPTAERPHGLKYSLFFGRPGKRIVGYDNERGKGDHRHYGPFEERYLFVSLDRLLEDFDADVRKEQSRIRASDRGRTA
ncbi:MAG: DUF6516 family protein [Roseitalea porphyridii]|uniref:toxin-antitoxin system TumE family protein n=1 Tax=Roseitalea porphyridii TaxID=1852022 RepID=UPI0032D9543F